MRDDWHKCGDSTVKEYSNGMYASITPFDGGYALNVTSLHDAHDQYAMKFMKLASLENAMYVADAFGAGGAQRMDYDWCDAI